MSHALAVPRFVPLRAHHTTLHLLLHLIDLADRGRPDGLLPFLEPSEIDELRCLPVKDLLRIAEQSQPILKVSIDTGQLRLCLQRLRSRDDGETDKLWFIRRGAPHILMTELFGTTERDFRSLRRVAGFTGRTGRPAAVDEQTEIEVVTRWRAFNAQTTIVQRYRVIGEAFSDLSLATLYNILHGEG